MDVCATVVADEETAESVQPGEGALDFPAVATESFAGFPSGAGDARDDAAATAGCAIFRRVIGLVCVEFARPLAWSSDGSGDGLHRVEHALQHRRVVNVCRRHLDREGKSVSVDNQVMFAARAPSVARVRSGILAPLFAGTSDESTEARSQSIRPASPSH